MNHPTDDDVYLWLEDVLDALEIEVDDDQRGALARGLCTEVGDWYATNNPPPPEPPLPPSHGLERSLESAAVLATALPGEPLNAIQRAALVNLRADRVLLQDSRDPVRQGVIEMLARLIVDYEGV